MVTMFGRHPVENYEAWRQVMDEYRAVRIAAGVVDEAIYQSVDDANDITMIFEFQSLDAARAFPENEELQAALRQAGAIGTPAIWYTKKV